MGSKTNPVVKVDLTVVTMLDQIDLNERQIPPVDNFGAPRWRFGHASKPDVYIDCANNFRFVQSVVVIPRRKILTAVK